MSAKSIQLLCRPDPKTFESWRGYILRLAEANRISPRVMLSRTEIEEKNLRTTFPGMQYVCELSGKTAGMLSEIYPIPLPKGYYRFLGHEIPKDYLRVNSPALCSDCIKASGYIHARWDVSTLTSCHIHGRKLLTHCPSCQSKITWYRQGLLICRCGYDFSLCQGEAARQDELNYAACLTAVIERSANKTAFQASPIPKQFFKMELRSFLGIVNTLGNKSLNNDGVYQKRARFGSPIAIDAGIKVLHNWESEFQKIMQDSEQKTVMSVRKSNQGLYSSLFKKRYLEKDIEFIKLCFAKISLKINDKRLIDRRLKKSFPIEDQQLKYLGINDAARALGKMPSTIRALIRKGEVSYIKQSYPGGYTKYLVDMHSIERKLPNSKGELGMRQAAAYVGLPVSVMKYLRSNNHFECKHQVILSKSWAIPDLDNFIQRLFGLGQGNCLSNCHDPVELKSSIKNSKFGSDDLKAQVIVGILQGEIQLFSSSDYPSKLYLSKAEILGHIKSIKEAA